MATEETPDRQAEKPPSDHQFETPVVRETEPEPVGNEEGDGPEDGAGLRRRPAADRRRASRPARH